MKYWDELVKIGLLGTEKMPLNIALLPPALQTTVAALDSKDREAYFYKCAALVLQYGRAGTIPTRASLPRVQVCKDESLPYMPAAYPSVLQALLSEKYRRFPRLLIQFLQKIVQKGYVVSPEWICTIFKQLETREISHHQSLVLEATGERGK